MPLTAAQQEALYYARKRRKLRQGFYGGDPVTIDRTTGANIGDMTAVGGLAAAFDGNDNQAGSASAAKTSTTFAYVGKSLAEAKRISHIVAYSSNDQGFVVTNNPSVTLELYGKQGAAPTDDTDGILLGSETVTDTATRQAVTVNSADQASYFFHVWLRVSVATTQSLRVAELEIHAAG